MGSFKFFPISFGFHLQYFPFSISNNEPNKIPCLSMDVLESYIVTEY